MKKLLIAASILVSSSAIAVTGPLSFTFSVDNTSAKSCSLEQINTNAKLSFYNDGDIDSWGHTYLHSNLMNKATVTVANSWSNTDAWGGNTPKITTRLSRDNKHGYFRDDWENAYNFEKMFPLHESLNMRTQLSFSVQTEKPTHPGNGSLDMVVQIECE